MIDQERELELVPESVKRLLRPLLKSDIKVAFWEQNLTRCKRARPGVVPLPLRFALQLDHRFGSKWFLKKLHSFGLCESYNETSQYKYNYIRNKFHVKIESNKMKTILEVVDEGNDDVEEEMVDDELQSRNEVIDDVSGELELVPESVKLLLIPLLKSDTNHNLKKSNDIDQVLSDLRSNNPSNLNFCYLNANSVRNKFTDFQEVINDHIV